MKFKFGVSVFKDENVGKLIYQTDFKAAQTGNYGSIDAVKYINSNDRSQSGVSQISLAKVGYKFNKSPSIFTTPLKGRNSTRVSMEK